MSFVSENNSLSGYKTCIEAMKHAWEESQTAKTLLHTGLICGHRPPNPKTPPSGDLEQHDFLINILSSMFSRSDVGALGCPLPLCNPQHVSLKKLRELKNGSVLRFGFLFVVVFTQFHFPPGSLASLTQPYLGKTANSPLRKVKGGLFLGQCERKKSHSTCGFPGTLLLWRLSNGSSHFH